MAGTRWALEYEDYNVWEVGSTACLREGVHSAYENGKYSDLKITCQDQTFAVHEIIVAAQSKVLAAMIDNEFKEGESSHINLPDDNPMAIAYLVRFLYRGQYDPELDIEEVSDEDPSVDSKLSFQLHAELYALADKYDIPSLMFRAATLYHHAAEKLKRSKDIAQHCIRFLSSIPTVYTAPPAIKGKIDLRTIAARNMSRLSADIELGTVACQELRALREQILHDVPEFTYDLSLLLMRKPSIISRSYATGKSDPEDLRTPASKRAKHSLGWVSCTMCDCSGGYGRINDANKILEIEKGES